MPDPKLENAEAEIPTLLTNLVDALIKEFGLRTVVRAVVHFSGPIPLSISTVDRLVLRHHGSLSKINRIKAVRAITGWGLKDSKEWAERAYAFTFGKDTPDDRTD